MNIYSYICGVINLKNIVMLSHFKSFIKRRYYQKLFLKIYFNYQRHAFDACGSFPVSKLALSETISIAKVRGEDKYVENLLSKLPLLDKTYKENTNKPESASELYDIFASRMTIMSDEIHGSKVLSIAGLLLSFVLFAAVIKTMFFT